MNQSAMTEDCSLDPETLAAYIDGRLDPPAHAQMTAHVATCAACRDAVNLYADLNGHEILSTEGATIRQMPVRGGSYVPQAAMAVAASLVILLAVPQTREWLASRWTGGMSEVKAQYADLDDRKIASRFSGFEHRRYKRPTRSAAQNQNRPNPEMYGMKGVADQLDAIENKSAKQWRATAAAHLQLQEYPEAIAAIDAAVANSRDKNDPTLLNDVAAVYVDWAVFSGKPRDVARALEVAERAWKTEQTPESAWNRALAYEQAKPESVAMQAWDDYLKLETDPRWIEEARENRSRLEPIL